MKKVTAFVATQRKKATYTAVKEFEKNLQQYGDIEFEYVSLPDFNITFCKGCKQCFLKGEEYCPSKDDRDVLLRKMEQSDGIILATPTYTFQSSAYMKNFLDRLGFLCHRPRFFGKTCTAIVTQAFYGGSNVFKYLNFSAESLGFKISKGCVLTCLDPMTPLQKRKMIVDVQDASARFYFKLNQPVPSPSLLRLMIFRMSRTNIRNTLDEKYKDYQHYKGKGWFESDYFYPVSLGVVKKMAGHVFDLVAQQMYKKPSQ